MPGNELFINVMDPIKLQLWNVIGTWIASIGTVSAVIVSLWLSYTKGKLNLQVQAGHRLVVTPGIENMPEYCSIRVVNAGDKPANITHVGWETGWFKNKGYFHQMFGTPGFDEVPKLIYEGQVANFMVPLRLDNDEEDWIVKFPKSLAGEKGNIRRIKGVRLVVTTSVGQIFKVRPEKGLIEKLVDSYEANK